MDKTLFTRFTPAMQAGAAPDDSNLCLAADGQLKVFYAPFEAVNTQAQVVLVGITPGRVQAANALAEARRQLATGASAEDAMRRAKEVGAFSGPMRSNLTAMLDRIGLNRWLGLASCTELFSTKAHLLQTSSVLQFPVFVDGENYNGSPDPMRTPVLRQLVLEHFARLGFLLPNAVFVPLGPIPTKVMAWLVEEGHFRSSQVLAGMPHPSGANAERIQYFLGRKEAGRLSAKTNAAALDAARAQLSSKVGALALR